MQCGDSGDRDVAELNPIAFDDLDDVVEVAAARANIAPRGITTGVAGASFRNEGMWRWS